MQYLSKPFYYNQNSLNNLIFIKILNTQYYAKLLYCSKEIYSFDTIITFSKKILKQQKNKNLSYKTENLFTNLYFDNFNFIEYLDIDFSKIKNIKCGFTFQYKKKHFSNFNITTQDFLEITFNIKNKLKYIKFLNNNFKKLDQNITFKYQNLIPIKLLKGGFLILGFGIFGFLSSNSLNFFSKQNINVNKFFYSLPLISFCTSFLKLFFYFKQKNKNFYIFKPKFYFIK